MKLVASLLSCLCLLSCDSTPPTSKSVLTNEKESNYGNLLYLNYVELIKENPNNKPYLTAEYTFFTCDTNYKLPFSSLDNLNINNTKTHIFIDTLTLAPYAVDQKGCNRVKMFTARVVIKNTSDVMFIKKIKQQIKNDSIYICDRSRSVKLSCKKDPHVGYLPLRQMRWK